MADLKATAQVLRDNCEVVIVAGIGGSYLGARAVIEALSNSFTWLQEKKTAPVMIYAGHNISEDYLYELTEFLKDKKFGVINISKSGTTTETALAFRLLKKQCEDQRGKEMAKKLSLPSQMPRKALPASLLIRKVTNHSSSPIMWEDASLY